MFIFNYRINDEWSSRICEIVDKTIIIGDVIDISFIPDFFYDKCVYSLDWYNEVNRYLEVRILYLSSQYLKYFRYLELTSTMSKKR